MSMGIRSVGMTNIYENQQKVFLAAQRLASAKRINAAADDAAGLAISKKLESLVRSTARASDNGRDMQNALNVADSALGSTTESLQRMRELSVQSANGIYTDEDRAAMQMEVGQLKDHVGKIASTTNFNKQPLLDGTFQNKNAAVNADGTGIDISIGEHSLEGLSLTNFEVADQNYTIGNIDTALGRVNSSRSNIGAMTNRLDHTVRNNDNVAENLESGRSRIEDQDMAKGIMDYLLRNAIKQYQTTIQKKQMQSAGSVLSLLA